MNVIAVDEKQVTVMKAGKSGKDANDGSVNPVFTVNLPSPVETTGLRIVFTTVISMVNGSLSVFELEAF